MSHLDSGCRRYVVKLGERDLMSTQMESQHAARVLDVVRGNRGLVAGSTVGAEIAASWRRCMFDYSLDLDREPDVFVLDQRALADYRARYEHLIQIASAEIDWLYDHMAMAGSALVLTDAAGILLYERVDPAVVEDVRRAGLRLGADWSESRQGTNGMGTCLAEDRPIIVHREEHFRTRLIGLSCTAAPIHDASGALVAALDVTTLNAQGTRDTQSHVLSLVHLSAKLIEKCLFLRHFQNGHVLRFHARPEFVNLQHDGALALGDDARVIAADEMALRLLGVEQRTKLIGRRIDQIFDVRAEEMVDPASRSDHHLWSIRDALVGRRYFASMSSESTDVNLSAYFAGGRGNPCRSKFPVPVLEPRHLGLEDLAGGDPLMQRNVRNVRRIAASNVSVMIQGATGTGKELMARALHQASGRASFVALNCAAIPESLIESELFGYRAGAFTGARRDGAKGIIVQASGGTLFLDEIGDMPLVLQTRLLRVLEEQEVLPLGAERAIKVNLRVVCASHQSLRDMIDRGQFRADLYYRLNGLTLELPTLAERADKEQLIRRMLGTGSGQQIDNEAFQCLCSYSWPGNIRELRNVTRVALAICEGGMVRLPDLPAEVRQSSQRGTTTVSAPSLGPIEVAERQALVEAIQQTGGNMARAALLLRVSRSTLYRHCKELGVSIRAIVPDSRSAPPPTRQC
jgi:sigma-54 dependent transcriptional regulator, acetoin dehydrogenase operon transcriptional activator AcoR